MRNTSVEAYRKLKESGALSRQRWIVYEAMFNHGPMTAAEMCARLKRSGLWKRCSELKKAGLFKETQIRRCSVSGARAIEMDVTDHAPDADKLKDMFKRVIASNLFVVKAEGAVGRVFASESPARTYWENEDKIPDFYEVRVVRRLK